MREASSLQKRDESLFFGSGNRSLPTVNRDGKLRISGLEEQRYERFAAAFFGRKLELGSGPGFLN